MKLRVMGTLLALSWALGAPAHAQVTTVVKKDQLLGNDTIRKFRAAIVSDAAGERISFRGTVRGLTGSRHGIYRVDDAGNGGAIAERGQSVPCESTTFRNFLQPPINSSGDVAWFGFLSNGGRGLFRTIGGDAANHRRLVVEGSPFPPIAGAVFSDFDAPEITSSGVVVFWAEVTLANSQVREGIFALFGGSSDCMSGMGTVVVIAMDGDAVPDAPGLEFCSFNRGIGVGAFGLAFRASIAASCGGGGTIGGVFRSDLGGSVETIAVQGGATDINLTNYRLFDDVPTIENDGIVAFRADTTGGRNIEAVFVCDPALDCPSSTLPQSIVESDTHSFKRIENPQITDAGDVIFRARSRVNPNGPALRVRRANTGNIQTIVERDDPVPDAGPQAVFRKVGLHDVSPGGDVVFSGVVKGADDGWRRAIFLWED